MGLTNQSQRDMVALVRHGQRLVDRVSTAFWERVLAMMTVYQGHALTIDDRRSMMREVDRLIGFTYGLTLSDAIGSELFRAILRGTDAAAEVPYRRAIKRVRTVAETRDSRFWERIREQATPATQDDFLKMMAQIDGPVIERQRLLRSKRLDPQRRWTPKESWNTKTGYRLSDRVWRSGRITRQAIDARLREGIRTGEDSLKIARSLERYLNPAIASEKIRVDGTIVRRNQTAAPGRGGYGNYPARRLARTEITRIHGAATVATAKITPGSLGVQWLLSNRHAGIDECNSHATRDGYGLGPGVYPPESVPIYPVHPHDLCTLAPVMKSREDVIADLVKRYGE